MQALIILALLGAFSLFMLSESNRNDATHESSYKSAKANFAASNILRYMNTLQQYVSKHYDEFINLSPQNPGSVEKVTVLSSEDQASILAEYSMTNFRPFYDFTSVVFNYSKPNSISFESSNSTLYIATTWNENTPNALGYRGLSMNIVLGQLGQMLGKTLYQGGSTYWLIPWVFTNNNCYLVENFTQLPQDKNGNSQLTDIRELFNKFCVQLQNNRQFTFGNYVYIRPVYSEDASNVN